MRYGDSIVSTGRLEVGRVGRAGRAVGGGAVRQRSMELVTPRASREGRFTSQQSTGSSDGLPASRPWFQVVGCPGRGIGGMTRVIHKTRSHCGVRINDPRRRHTLTSLLVGATTRCPSGKAAWESLGPSMCPRLRSARIPVAWTTVPPRRSWRQHAPGLLAKRRISRSTSTPPG
jgi:hypothetical protein